MVNGKEKLYIDKLESLLSSEFDVNSYSLLRPKESAACLGQLDGRWVVYGYERGNLFQVKMYDSLVDAGLDLVYRLGMNNDPKRLQKEFLNAISENTL